MLAALPPESVAPHPHDTAGTLRVADGRLDAGAAAGRAAARGQRLRVDVRYLPSDTPATPAQPGSLGLLGRREGVGALDRHAP